MALFLDDLLSAPETEVYTPVRNGPERQWNGKPSIWKWLSHCGKEKWPHMGLLEQNLEQNWKVNNKVMW